MNYIASTPAQQQEGLCSQSTAYACLAVIARDCGKTCVLTPEGFVTPSMDPSRRIILDDMRRCFLNPFPVASAGTRFTNITWDTDMARLSPGVNYNVQPCVYPQTKFIKTKADIDLVRTIYRFHPRIEDVAKTEMARISGQANLPLVAVHYRDYYTPNQDEIHLTLSRDYYLNALAILRVEIGRFAIVGFASNLERFKGFGLGAEMGLPEFYPNTGDVIELCMMTKCDHMIISASSFGSFGALLNRRGGKVICPKKFLHDAFDRQQPPVNRFNGRWYFDGWTPLDIT